MFKKYIPILIALLIVASPVFALSIFTVIQGGTGKATLPASQLIYGNGTGAVGSVATTTLTASSPLSLSQAVVKVGGSNSVLALDTSGSWTGSAGSVANALTAGTGLSSAGTFTGATARTFSIDNAYSNTWSVLQNFNYSSSTIYSSFLTSSSTFAQIGQLTLSTTTAGTLKTNATGLVYVDTSGASGVTSVTGTWPIISSGGNTPNLTWGGLATSSALTNGRVHYSTGVNTFADVATSSIASGVGITVTNGTTAYVLGAQPSIACNTASASVFGCLSASDFSKFNSATTTFSTGLTYTLGTNAVTLNTANSNTWSVLQNFNYSSSTVYSSFQNSSTTNANIGILTVPTLTSALTLTGAGGIFAEYTGTSCTNQFVRSLSALGVATCATVANTDLANSTISGVSLGSNLNSLSNDATLNGTSYNGSASVSDWGLNLANANTWTVNQTFNYSSSTVYSSFLTSSTTNGFFGKAGVGTTTPFALVSINPLGAVWPFIIGSSTRTLLGVNDFGGIILNASQPATSTTITLDWSKTGPQVEYRIGTSATTITLINATTSLQWGSTKRVWICNPNNTAGAVTWAGVQWFGGTAPTQTTTANKCDMYSFDITRATSSTAYLVAGGANTGF